MAQAKLSQQATIESGSALKGTAGTLDLVDEGAEDRQRQIRVPGFGRLVEPVRQLALARQGAIPRAAVIGDPPHVPVRKREIDQRQGRVGAGTGGDQAVDLRRPFAVAGTPDAPRLVHDLPQQRSGHGGRLAKPLGQLQAIMVGCRI
jgi:hypothetical protein